MSEPAATSADFPTYPLSAEEQQKFEAVLGRKASPAEVSLLEQVRRPGNSQIAAPFNPFFEQQPRPKPSFLDIGDSLAALLLGNSCEVPLDPKELTRGLINLIWESLEFGVKPQCLLIALGPAQPTERNQVTNSDNVVPSAGPNNSEGQTSFFDAIASVSRSFGIPARITETSFSTSLFCLGVRSCDNEAFCASPSQAAANTTITALGENATATGKGAQQLDMESTGLNRSNDVSLPAISDTAFLLEALPALMNSPVLSLVCAGSGQALKEEVAFSLNEEDSVVILKEKGIEKICRLTVVGDPNCIDLRAPQDGNLTVAEAARELTCSGSLPLGASIQLILHNSSSPETAAPRGAIRQELEATCHSLRILVTDSTVRVQKADSDSAKTGNSSLVLAMLGIIQQEKHETSKYFKDEGDAIILLGDFQDSSDPLQGLGGSAYLGRFLDHQARIVARPALNWEYERELQLALRALIYSGEIKSAYSCGRGGIAVALAQSCISYPTLNNVPKLLGAIVELPSSPAAGQNTSPGSEPANSTARLDGILFGEKSGRVIVSTHPTNAVKVIARSRLLGVAAARIGTVGWVALEIKTPTGELRWSLEDLHSKRRQHIYRNRFVFRELDCRFPLAFDEHAALPKTLLRSIRRLWASERR